MAKGITVRGKHTPGVENVRTDRIPATGGWIPIVFLRIFNRWGPPQVDLSAARHNAQLLQYFTFKTDPGVVAVDAFAQDWSNLTPYAFPPFLIVGRCLQMIWEEKVEKAVIMEGSSMEPTTPPHEHQQSLPSSPIKGPANEPSARSASPHGLGRTDPDCLAGIRQSLENKGISEKAVNLICASGR